MSKEWADAISNGMQSQQAIYNLAVKQNLVEPDEVRLTINARDKKAKELENQGLTRDKIAEILGTSPSTIDRALKKDSTKVVPEAHHSGAEEPITDTKPIDPLEQSKKREDSLREQLKLAQQRPKLVVKTYETIVLDPPWPMKKIERDVRPNQVEFDYPTMTEDELRDFRVDFRRMAADSCHVFMWTTPKFLPMALRLFEEYDIKYVLPMVWHKPGGFQPIGLPQYNAEFVLYGRRGTPKFIDTKAFNICFQAPRQEHSRKPKEFYELLCRVTEGPRIDVFSRERHEGFDQFGNEVGKFGDITNDLQQRPSVGG